MSPNYTHYCHWYRGLVTLTCRGISCRTSCVLFAVMMYLGYIYLFHWWRTRSTLANKTLHRCPYETWQDSFNYTAHRASSRPISQLAIHIDLWLDKFKSCTFFFFFTQPQYRCRPDGRASESEAQNITSHRGLRGRASSGMNKVLIIIPSNDSHVKTSQHCRGH